MNIKLLKFNYHINYVLFACEGKQQSCSQKRPFHILFNEVAVMDGWLAWPIRKIDFFPFLINKIFAFFSELHIEVSQVISLENVQQPSQMEKLKDMRAPVSISSG